MGGRGRVKSAMQVVHSHGSIEVVLTKPHPSPLEQHCAGLSKSALGEDYFASSSSLEWALINLPGGGGDGWQAAESLRAQCGFEDAV